MLRTEEARLRAFALLGTALLVSIAFLPHLRGDFVWDDRVYILNNPRLRVGASAWELLTRPFALGGAVYRPVSTFTFWLQVQLTGHSMVWLRSGNVLVHVTTALVVGAWLRRLSVHPVIAMLLAWAFLVHPGATELAMFANARHDALGTACALAALVTWPREKTDARALVAPIVFVTMAIACKESFLVLPLLIAIEEVRGGLTLRWRTLAPIVPIVAFFGLRALLHVPSGSDQLRASFGENLRTFATLLHHYGVLTLTFRNGLTVERFVLLSALSTTLVYVVIASIFVGLFVLHRRGSPHARIALFGLVWFVVAVAPNVLAVPLLGQYANRYAYFPSIGAFMMIAAALDAARSHISSRLQRPLLIASGVALLGLSLATTAEASVWDTEEHLFANDMRDAPKDSRVLYHYGVVIADRQGCERALAYFVASVEYEPTYARAWRNVTACLLNLRRIPQAIAAGRRALELAPQEPSNLYNLGSALIVGGAVDEGVALLERALVLDPTNERVRRALESARESHK